MTITKTLTETIRIEYIPSDKHKVLRYLRRNGYTITFDGPAFDGMKIKEYLFMFCGERKVILKEGKLCVKLRASNRP